MPELKEVLSANSPIIEKTRFSMLTTKVLDKVKQTAAIKQVSNTGGNSHTHTPSAFGCAALHPATCQRCCMHSQHASRCDSAVLLSPPLDAGVCRCCCVA